MMQNVAIFDFRPADLNFGRPFYLSKTVHASMLKILPESINT